MMQPASVRPAALDDEGIYHCAGEALKVAQLILVGSCRGEADRDRVAKLRQTARELGIEDRVQFCVNIPYAGALAISLMAVAALEISVQITVKAVAGD